MAETAYAIVSKDKDKRIFGFWSIIVSMRPFTVITYEDNPEGAQAMLTKIRDLGFAITPEEAQVWAAWRNDDEDED